MATEHQYLLNLAEIDEILEEGSKHNDVKSAQHHYVEGFSRILDLIKDNGITEEDYLGHVLIKCSEAIRRFADLICSADEESQQRSPQLEVEIKDICVHSVNVAVSDFGPRNHVPPTQSSIDQQSAPKENTLLYDYKMSDIIGMENVKKVFWETFMLPKIAPQLFENISSWKSVLLFGPSGTGKTSAICGAAGESNWNFIVVVPAELYESHYGDSEKQIKCTLERALSKRPCIIIFDEAESMSPKRTGNTSAHDLRFSSQLLQTLSEAVEKYDDIVIVGITNTPEICDKAFMRRFETKCFVALPSLKQRAELYKKYLNKHKNDLKDTDFITLAEESQKFSGDDIKCLVKCIYLHEAGNYVLELQKKGIAVENIRYQKNTLILKKKTVSKFVKKWKASLSEGQDKTLCL